MKNMMYRDAVREALDEEMARDDTVFNMGEDVGFLGGNFKCTEGLMDKYGDLRCKDTPISEQDLSAWALELPYVDFARLLS